MHEAAELKSTSIVAARKLMPAVSTSSEPFLPATPPVVEVVFGAQFSPLTMLTSGHFGLFWKELGEDWATPLDAPPVAEQFELFDRPRWSAPTEVQFRLEPVRLPNRFLVENRSKDRLIQLQSTRFLLNWRKKDDVYPGYQSLADQFEEAFNRFKLFAEQSGIGSLELNQWELSYIDSFPQGEYWRTPADWSGILPGLFGSLFPTEGLSVALENRKAEWTFEIEPKRGRLHVAARAGRSGDDQRESLLLHMTARGPVGKGGADSLRSGLDLGHKVVGSAFLRLVDEATRNRCGAK
ncbi:MAG: TIGR04255 family protein [Planctomycetia bacterium]